MNEPTDAGFFNWAFSAAIGFIGAAIGHLYIRLNVIARQARVDSDAGDRELWEEITRRRDSETAFREAVLRDTATKSDLREMKQDIIAALSPRATASSSRRTE